METTCATPERESRRSLTVWSTNARISVGSVSPLRLRTPMIWIWPMMLEMGVIWGTMPGGSCARASWSFSWTIWRLR